MTHDSRLGSFRHALGLFFVRAGRSVGRLDEPLAESIAASGPDEADLRPVLATELKIVVSHHAVVRYGERTGREMGKKLEAQELQSVWPHAVISSSPPDWHRPPGDEVPGTLYAAIADLLIPLVPYDGRANTHVATTVLSKVGTRGALRSAGVIKKRSRAGTKVKRRKWSERGRPRADDDEYGAAEFE